MTVKDWSVSHEYLPRMIHDDELGIKRLGSCGFVLSCLTSNITSMKILYCYILDVDCGIEETRGVYWFRLIGLKHAHRGMKILTSDIVTRKCLTKLKEINK
jgi:hypothetical protein